MRPVTPCNVGEAFCTADDAAAKSVQVIKRIEGFGLRSMEVIVNDPIVEHELGHSKGRIVLVAEGTLVDVMENGEKRCQAGAVIYRPPGLAHTIRIVGVPFRAVLIEIDERQLAEFSMLFERPGVPTHLSTEPPGCNILQRLLAELRSADEASAMAIHALVSSLVVEASRMLNRRIRRLSWMDQALILIEQHYHEPLSLRDIAFAVGVSAARLAHQFRSDLGYTVGEYIRRLRVDRAARLLMETAHTLSDIAALAGFYDHSHFTRTFREIMGQTPTRFRRTHRP